MKIILEKEPLRIHEQGQRQNQEDYITQWNNRLFIVCDGMGGHEKGEVASKTFSEGLVKWFSEHIAPNDFTFTDAQLTAAIEYAYQELDKEDKGDSLKKMGTTLTLLYIHERGITAAYIGDSRIYHLRPSQGILYQSRDHSLVFDKYWRGDISYEEMATDPQKNVILKAVIPGIDNREKPSIIHITDIEPGDYFYMCSDGMLEHMTNDELMMLFASGNTNEEKQKLLIEETKYNADNHTAWILQVNQVTKEKGDFSITENEENSTKNALNRPKPQEVQMAEVEDVEIVSQAPHATPYTISRIKRQIPSPTPSRSPRKLIKWIIPIIAILSIAILTGITLYPYSGEEKQKTQTEQQNNKAEQQEKEAEQQEKEAESKNDTKTAIINQYSNRP